MHKIAEFVITIGIDMGDNINPYTTKKRQPKEFIIRNFITDFIKNDTNTVAIAAYPTYSTKLIPNNSIINLIFYCNISVNFPVKKCQNCI